MRILLNLCRKEDEGKPEVLSKEAFEKEVSDNGREILYRGVMDRKYLNQMQAD